jgi:hypothetical protein
MACRDPGDLRSIYYFTVPRLPITVEMFSTVNKARLGQIAPAAQFGGEVGPLRESRNGSGRRRLGKDGAHTLRNLTDGREFKPGVRMRIMRHFNFEAFFDLEHDLDQIQGFDTDFVEPGFWCQCIDALRTVPRDYRRDLVE